MPAASFDFSNVRQEAISMAKKDAERRPQRQQPPPPSVVGDGVNSDDRSHRASVVEHQHQQPQQQYASLTTRVVSGSAGSLVTSLLVTPLDVVKVRMQAAMEPPPPPPPASPSSSSSAATAAAKLPPNVAPCPRGCGTFVLNTPHGRVVLPRSAAPFFDGKTGTLTDKARQCLFAGEVNKRTANTAAADVGTFKMLRRIFRSEGFPGIYAGLRPTLVMAVPNTVLYFSAYEEMVFRLRRYCSGDSGSAASSLSWAIPLVSGGTARVVAASATAPFEFLRTRQASIVGGGGNYNTSNSNRGGIVADFAKIVREEGIGTLYRGLRPTLWRDVPFSAIYWVCLEKMREAWRRNSPDIHPSPSTQAMQAFTNGAISGMIAAAFTTPFDVVKTRQQQVQQQGQQLLDGAIASVASGSGSAGAGATGGVSISCTHDGAAVYEPPPTSGGVGRSASSSTFAQLRRIAETEGVQGLWKGNQARMLKVAPACAIMISSYELGKRLLE